MWLWSLVRVDAFQIAVARLCHYPLLWGCQWMSFRRENCQSESRLPNTGALFEPRHGEVLAKQRRFSEEGVATSPDTISKLTTITDWQLTRHTLCRRGMTVQEVALSVSALGSQKQYRPVLCVALYVTAAEPMRRPGEFFFQRSNRGRWSIKNNQRQMTSPSKMERIKHLCAYSLGFFFCRRKFVTHNCTQHGDNGAAFVFSAEIKRCFAQEWMHQTSC